jgi:hypothetical protein
VVLNDLLAGHVTNHKGKIVTSSEGIWQVPLSPGDRGTDTETSCAPEARHEEHSMACVMLLPQ